MQVRREEYLDHMTFRANRRPLFTEILSPIVGLKEEWAAQGATPEERYGRRLAMIGGIDKHVPRRSREEIVAELEYKIPPMVRTGGCLLGLDHRIPNGTPLANYRFHVEKAWGIMEREAAQLG